MTNLDLPPAPSRPMTVSQLCAWGWSTYLGRNRSVRSTKSIVLGIGNWFGPKLLSSLEYQDLIDWLDHLRSAGDKPSTIRRKVGTLSGLLKRAQLAGFISRVPAMPKVTGVTRGRLRWLSEPEETKLLDHLMATSPDVGYLVVFLLDTGMRPGEALALRWSDVFPERGVVTLYATKTDRERSVPLTARARAALEAMHGKIGGPFQHISIDKLNRAWNVSRRAIGLGDDAQVVPYVCRHTFASRLAQRGVSLYTIGTLLGHTNSATTTIYAHLATHNLRAAVDTLENRP